MTTKKNSFKIELNSNQYAQQTAIILSNDIVKLPYNYKSNKILYLHIFSKLVKYACLTGSNSSLNLIIYYEHSLFPLNL